MYAKFMFPNVPEFPECPFSVKEKIKYAKTGKLEITCRIYTQDIWRMAVEIRIVSKLL